MVYRINFLLIVHTCTKVAKCSPRHYGSQRSALISHQGRINEDQWDRALSEGGPGGSAKYGIAALERDVRLSWVYIGQMNRLKLLEPTKYGVPFTSKYHVSKKNIKKKNFKHTNLNYTTN